MACFSLPELSPEIPDLDFTSSSDLAALYSLKRYSLATPTLGVRRPDGISLAAIRRDQRPGYFITRELSPAMKDWKVHGGICSPKKLVVIPDNIQGDSPNSAKFAGVKTTIEFKPTDGTKAVVGMTRYNLLTTREDGDGLDLDEGLSLFHVFSLEELGKDVRKGKRPRAVDQFNDWELPPLPSGFLEPERREEPLNVEDYPVDSDVLEIKRPGSELWQGFIKIHTTTKLMFAVCKRCYTVLKLKDGLKSGTSSLKNHNGRCKPKQEMLPGSSSSIPTLSIALEGHPGMPQ